MSDIKFKWRIGHIYSTAWYLLPTIRFGLHKGSRGGFIAFTFLKFDACLVWTIEGLASDD